MLPNWKPAFACVALSAVFITSCTKLVEQNEPRHNTVSAEVTATNNLTDPKALLGKKIFFDLNLSEPVGVQSCASCHMPQTGFFGLGDAPTGGTPRGFIGGIGEGAVAGRFGNRKAPSAAYATYSPVMRMVAADLEFVGGLFWDGRATGLTLGSPAAEQAQGPFLNPNEQNHPTKRAVLEKLAGNPEYQSMWSAAWGSPIALNNTTNINLNYDRLGLSIAAYEGSSEVNAFTSKFDAYQRGQAQLTAQELQGFQLFSNKAECYDCHTPNGNGGVPALFTDFSYANLGVPKNPLNPVYLTNPSFVDLGLGGFLANQSNRTWKNRASFNMGKFKTPTLRNVAKGGPNRRYMHNGVFTSLEQVVHFYNTRDVAGAGWNGVPWGAPEYPSSNIIGHQKMGRLGLTPIEEAAIVAFLRTLDDGWQATQ